MTGAAAATRTTALGTFGALATSVTVQRIQVLRLERDNIVVITQLTGLGGETQVSDRRNGDVRVLGVEGEAVGPGILRLVLQVQSQGLVLEVGKTELSGDGGIAEATRGAASQFVGLAVVGLVVGGRAVAHHGHDVGEGHAGAVVLVCVDEDTETFEAVG